MGVRIKISIVSKNTSLVTLVLKCSRSKCNWLTSQKITQFVADPEEIIDAAPFEMVVDDDEEEESDIEID